MDLIWSIVVDLFHEILNGEDSITMCVSIIMFASQITSQMISVIKPICVTVLKLSSLRGIWNELEIFEKRTVVFFFFYEIRERWSMRSSAGATSYLRFRTPGVQIKILLLQVHNLTPMVAYLRLCVANSQVLILQLLLFGRYQRL
jgi:hypothetical protein